MSYTDATDQVLAVLDNFKIAAFENDEQYEALANSIRQAIAMHVRHGLTDPLQDPGVQGLAQLGRNAIERVAKLEEDLATAFAAMRDQRESMTQHANELYEGIMQISDERDRLRAELAGYVEANRYMAGELEDALDDARKYAEAQREIARLRDALSNLLAVAEGQGGTRRDAHEIARAALAKVAEVPE